MSRRIARAHAASAGSEPAVGKRERNTLRNREAILAAAREVFSELGYGAATIRAIVRRTDLAAGTFYNYFPDKESVLRTILEDFAARVRQRAHEARMEARTLEDLMRSSFLTCFKLYAEETTLIAMMARNAGEIPLIGSSGMILEPAIAELVADLRAKEREGIVPQLDVERTARVAVALAHELGLHMLSRKPLDIVGTTEFATRFMLGGTMGVAGAALAALESQPGQTPACA